ncbi:hypothetical protein CR165_08470 [Pseudoroseomonas aestuarii]|uniref:Histidine phosphotransferase ChpT C-terminal domain-containing protein n=2 Tax=Teichococcus aestuarii TaxID=568898 RepID=A0A2U1V5N1_9PROT|nr:hypothetical protein CR165_08470 [Pseudoroseomonas aestuarii]
MAMEGGTSLAQDLCARLCHDMVGPLGTVGAALDLLGEEPEAPALAQDAAAELRRRLKFWRAACGAGTGPLAVSGLTALLEGMLAGGRARLVAEAMPAERVLAAPVAPLLLLGALLVGEALPRGGTVTLAPQGEGFVLRPEGAMRAWPAALPALLRGEAVEGARAAPALLLLRLAAAAGWRVALAPESEPDALRIAPGG